MSNIAYMSAKVHFIVSSGMTKYDIKNYLEKIYKVPVADVRTLNKMGKTRQNAFGSYIVKDDDYKMAYVTLPPGMLTVFSNCQFKLVPQIDPSVPQPVVQSQRRPLLGPSPG